jgi:hypothetical protein
MYHQTDLPPLFRISVKKHRIIEFDTFVLTCQQTTAILGKRKKVRVLLNPVFLRFTATPNAAAVFRLRVATHDQRFTRCRSALSYSLPSHLFSFLPHHLHQIRAARRHR